MQENTAMKMECEFCDGRVVAKANGHWVCHEHAIKFTVLCLNGGNTVVMAQQGEPQVMLLPVSKN